MRIVTNAAGLIVMMTERGNPTPPIGGTSYSLSEEELAAFKALPPNGGVIFVPGEDDEPGIFTPLPALPPPVFPDAGGEALIERRARRAEKKSDDLTALKLRMGVR